MNTGMSLRGLDLRVRYRSGSDDLLNDFYVPCLKRASVYKRAVGYFTSAGLSVAAQGIAHLITCGGSIQLIASPVLREDDIVAIRKGHKSKQEVVESATARELAEIESQLIHDRLNALAWLVSAGHLHFKLALRVDQDGVPASGIYHEKIGVIIDPQGDYVAFSGSTNETAGGLVENFERIDVYRSWNDPQGHSSTTAADFDAMWNGIVSGIEIYDFSETASELFRPYRGATPPSLDPLEQVKITPVPDDQWRHQDEAITAFLAIERGVLEMATGTGKTRTSLRICEFLLSKSEIESVVVTADGNDLLDQWYQQLLVLATCKGRSYRINRHYGPHHERDYFILDPIHTILLASRQALPPALASITPELARRTMLIHDEVHKLGSPSNREKLAGLTDNIRFRLGLSATPERTYDQEGTTFIEKHVGPICYRFGLSDAIERKILCPFDYHALEYTPNDDDRKRLQQVYKRVAARRHSGQPMSKEEIWTDLARVHKTSQAKLPVFESFIAQQRSLLERCIIFVETQEYGEAVLRLVHRYRHDFHTYFSGEDSEVLLRFARGDLECLLTCHRLSEGIDIQNLKSVILFSSARARLETIQRMGRCLRVDPDNPGKRANIVDFIRITDVSGIPDDDNADQSRCVWLKDLSAVRPVKDFKL